MKCEQIAEFLPDYLHSRLQPEQSGLVEEHLQQCEQCMADVALWRKLGTLPEEQPSPALRARFAAMLESYQEGRWEKTNLKREHGRFLDLGAVMHWMRTPALSVAWALVLLIGGFLAGRYVDREDQKQQLASVRQELVNMQQLVVVSMLRQQSASDRLQGVSYSLRQPEPDAQVLAALVHTLRYDNSVDVRLAALDALSRYGSRPDVRQGLKDALQPQQSPLVQVALIDVLVELHESSALPQLKQFQTDPKVDPNVRKHADWGIQQLS